MKTPFGRKTEREKKKEKSAKRRDTHEARGAAAAPPAPPAPAPAGVSVVVMEVVTQWVAPTAGVVIANAMFATPMRAVLQARKQGTLSDLNPVPWAAIVCNCAAWIGYSYFKKVR